jgi:hypothetical protein
MVIIYRVMPFDASVLHWFANSAKYRPQFANSDEHFAVSAVDVPVQRISTYSTYRLSIKWIPHFSSTIWRTELQGLCPRVWWHWFCNLEINSIIQYILMHVSLWVKLSRTHEDTNLE